MCGKGSNTTTTQTAPNPVAMGYYNQALGMAANAAATPYSPYTGQEVAPVNQTQQAGINQIIGNSTQAQPSVNQGVAQIFGSSQPLNAGQIQQYESPYTQQVINATQAQFNNQNAQQQAGVVGNAASQGALGGDRVGVAQALTAQQQQLAQAPVIAGLENTGYNQAVTTAEQQQQLGMQGGQAGVNAAIAGQNAALTGGNAVIGAGGVQQTTQQAQDTQAMSDYYQSQGYPFQVAQYLAGIATGVGSQMGGSSQTQGPAPNPWSQIAGLGVAAAGALASRGGRISGFADGGRIYRDNGGWVPSEDLATGSGPPSPPKIQNGSTSQPSLSGLGSLIGNGLSSVGSWLGDAASAVGSGISDAAGAIGSGISDAAAGIGSAIESGGAADALAVLAARRGGRVAGFAPGGRIQLASGGSGGPYGQYQSWVPSITPKAGSGAPKAPSLQNATSGLNANQLKGLGVLGKDAMNYYQTGNTDVSMSDLYNAPGITAADVEPGLTSVNFARGGRAGFADGGDPTDDTTFDDRFDAAFPNYVPPVVGGVGASQPAVDSGVVNPGAGNEIRMLPEATEDWRKGTAESRNVVPPKAPLPKVITGANDDDDEAAPSIRSGYAPTPYDAGSKTAGFPPQAQPSNTTLPDPSFLEKLGVHMTPELRQGLLQAGFALMANRQGGPGSFLSALGQAGATGVGAYNATIKEEQEQQEKAQKFAEEALASKLKVNNSLIGPNGEINEALLKAKEREATAAQKDNWVLAPGDGVSTPDRLYNRTTGDWKDAPPGKGQAALNVLQNGQFNYGTGGPHLEKGDAVPEPVAVAGRSVDTLKADAATYATTGILPKSSVSPKTPAGIQAQIYQNAVKNYANALGLSKGLTPEGLADIRRFGTNAAKFPLSRQGDQTVAIGTAIRHIGALEEYAKVWDDAKGNINAPILRQAAARFAKALGMEEPTNLEQAARIAGPEIIKAIGVAGAGTGGERFAQEEGFQPGASTKQILGSANVARTFLAGQLPAKEAQANNVGFPHDRFMSMVGPKEYDYLSAINHGKPAEDHGAGAGSGGGPVMVQTPADAAKLAPGTHYKTPDGREFVR